MKKNQFIDKKWFYCDGDVPLPMSENVYEAESVYRESMPSQ
jgi:hypothetical protein